MLYVGVLEAELFIPEAQSKKERRRVVSSLKERARSRYKVAAAEVGDADRLQAATLVFATAAGSCTTVEETLDTLERLVYSGEAEVSRIRRAVRSAEELWD
ncbi:MAG TPA: DUF503 domain-containing protein [Candidatus Coatesbacteria bacterium]|nr:DUF503 domain-containing protein [Candidatus Coatesbacteria bacterium]